MHKLIIAQIDADVTPGRAGAEQHQIADTQFGAFDGAPGSLLLRGGTRQCQAELFTEGSLHKGGAVDTTLAVAA